MSEVKKILSRIFPSPAHTFHKKICEILSRLDNIDSRLEMTSVSGQTSPHKNVLKPLVRPKQQPCTIRDLLPWIETIQVEHGLKVANEPGKKHYYDMQLHFSHVLPWLEKLPSDFRTILDVGCGFGNASAFFFSRGHEVTAIDSENRDFVMKGKIPLLISKIEDMPGNQRYDAIYLSHVLEHQWNIGFFLELLKSRLNDNGYLFVVVPHSMNVEQCHLFSCFSIPQLAAIMVTAGFDCSRAIFQRLGNYNTCGYGRKTSMLPSYYESSFIRDRLHMFPDSFKKLITRGGSFSQNVDYADANVIVRSENFKHPFKDAAYN